MVFDQFNQVLELHVANQRQLTGGAVVVEACFCWFYIVSHDLENSWFLNNSASPDSCFSRKSSSASIPICFKIHASLIPALVSSLTILLISSMSWLPLALLC